MKSFVRVTVRLHNICSLYFVFTCNETVFDDSVWDFFQSFHNTLLLWECASIKCVNYVSETTAHDA